MRITALGLFGYCDLVRSSAGLVLPTKTEAI